MKKIKTVLKVLLGFLLFTFVWWLVFAMAMFFDQGKYGASNFIIVAVSALKGILIFYGLVILLIGLISLLTIGIHLMTSEL